MSDSRLRRLLWGFGGGCLIGAGVFLILASFTGSVLNMAQGACLALLAIAAAVLAGARI